MQRFDRESLTGFVNTGTWLRQDGIELLTQSGTVALVAYEDAKSVFFVRDFGPDGPDDPGSTRRAFQNRPRLDGLWVRMTFRDGDELEGLMPNNLLQLDPAGVHVTPPEGAQKVFVPRAALRSMQVLGVVGSPLRGTKRGKKPAAREQIQLFDK